MTIEAQDSCSFIVFWHTPAACEVQIGLCQFLNKNEVFDLTKLRKSGGYQLRDPDRDIDFQLNVCADAGSSKCRSGTGMCDLTHESSAGRYVEYDGQKKSPSWNGDHATLKYSDGSVCPGKEGTTIRTETSIRFYCKPGTYGTPRFSDFIEGEKTCSYIVKWETCAVCPHETARCPGGTPPPSPHPTRPGPSSNGAHGGGGGSNTGAIVGALFAIMIVMGAVGYILISPERRYKVKQYFGQNKTPQYHYEKVGTTYEDSDASMLIGDSDSDDDDNILDMS